MPQPVIFVMDEDAGVTGALREDLTRRFGEDFQVIAGSSATAGLAALRRLAGAGEPVALLADSHLDAARLPVMIRHDGHTIVAPDTCRGRRVHGGEHLQ